MEGGFDIFGMCSYSVYESDPALKITAKQSSVGEFVSLAAILLAIISCPSKSLLGKK